MLVQVSHARSVFITSPNPYLFFPPATCCNYRSRDASCICFLSAFDTLSLSLSLSIPLSLTHTHTQSLSHSLSLFPKSSIKLDHCFYMLYYTTIMLKILTLLGLAGSAQKYNYRARRLACSRYT
eukprot:sb/3475776/